MDDPVTWIIKQVTRIMFHIGLIIGDGLNALFRAALRRGNRTRIPRPVRQKQQQIANTHEREEQYRQIVTQFNRTLGFIASEAISRAELEDLINQGIDPQDLISEIYRRIDKVPGIVLGKNQYLNDMEMKLPYSLRDRHSYLIGRSGSGKTNLIRLMLLQDIYYGQGVGVLAPEQELITEEILPYIPEERIEDVIYINPKDSTFPIAFNPLHCEPWEDKRTKIEDFVTIFKRAVGDTGFRMDDILDHTLEALIDRQGSTLLDIPRFLSRVNPQFRNEVLKTSSERVRMFFEEVYPTMERNAANPVISRINNFTAH
jgi:hypothetical protein